MYNKKSYVTVPRIVLGSRARGGWWAEVNGVGEGKEGGARGGG